MASTNRLAEAHGRLVAAAEQLRTGNDWQRFLDVARRFHHYSANNLLLILAQRPDATRVAGFRTWKGLGRWVRAGERGIAILAPVVYRARPVDEAEETEHPELARILRGFRVVHVFDVSQTDGQPLPEVARPSLLTGDAPDAFWGALETQVSAAGFTLERGHCGTANGRTDVVARTVTVRDDVESAQAAKTLAHELAHVLLHDTAEHSFSCRDRAEVEAESVAFLVCASAGLETDNYSFPYVAHWATDPKTVQATADRVITCTRRILTDAGIEDEHVAA